MTKLQVKVLETENVEHRGAINKRPKVDGNKSDGSLITVLLHPDGKAYGYVVVEGKIKPIPIDQLEVL